jgi:cell division protein ZapA
MAAINVEVNGRPYTVGCDDGQEEHVTLLARQFDRQVKDIAEQVGAVGELRLFLLAALTTADELSDVRNRLDRFQRSASAAVVNAPDPVRVEQRAAAALEEAAQRLEALAERVG